MTDSTLIALAIVLPLVGAVLIGVGLETSVEAIAGGLLFVVAGFAALLWLVNHPDFTLKQGTRQLAAIPLVSEERAQQATADFLQNLSAIAHPRRFAVVLSWSFISWSLLLNARPPALLPLSMT